MIIRVQVLGDRTVERALRQLNLKVKDLHAAWQRIGSKVKDDAVHLAPVLTGRLANNIRAGKGKSSAVIRSGSARLVYAPIQHYGGYHNIEAKPYLTTALHANEDYAEREVGNEIDRLIQRVGLD